jgi:hypothetical protein
MIRMVKPKAFDQYAVIIGNWDFAYSDAACYKALATLGVSDMRMTCLDVFCRQTADIEIALEYHYRNANRIVKTNEATVFFYDGSVAQKAIYDPILVRAARKYKSFCVPIAQKSTIDKYDKIDTVVVSALISGLLDFSQELEHNPDWEEARAQLLNFEKGGKYPVDFPDALADAIRMIQDYITGGDTEDDDPDTVNAPVIGKRELGGY